MHLVWVNVVCIIKLASKWRKTCIQISKQHQYEPGWTWLCPNPSPGWSNHHFGNGIWIRTREWRRKNIQESQGKTVILFGNWVKGGPSLLVNYTDWLLEEIEVLTKNRNIFSIVLSLNIKIQIQILIFQKSIGKAAKALQDPDDESSSRALEDLVFDFSDILHLRLPQFSNSTMKYL